MNAMTEPLAKDRLDETTHHGTNAEAQSDAPPSEQPTGNDLMADLHAPQPHRDRYAFASGDRPLDGYTIKRAVGRGGFGEVYYALSDSGREVALKLILRNLEIERRGVIQCMNLKCANLLTIFDLKTSASGDSFVVMEYVAGPSLAKVLRENPNGLPTAEVRHWMKGLVEGVAYLHDHGVVHRDLKPANLFLEEGVVKIGDYGLAKLIGSSRDGEHSEGIGTCHYMAPEIGRGNYGKPIDIYAVGVILHEMLTGRPPFDGESVTEIVMKHLTDRPDLSALDEPYRGIVARALAKDPRQRPDRAQDLLLPQDAPRVPEIRVPGARPTVDEPAPEPAPAPAPSVVVINRPNPEPIHRIESVDIDDLAETAADVGDDDESIFYIGPDTAPPPPRDPSRPRGGWRKRTRQRAARPPVAPRRAPGFVSARDELPGRDWSGRHLVNEPIPPAPLALTGRARAAELTASMIWAALALALLALPASSLLEIDLQREPQRLALLYGVALLATWMALFVAKSLEERRIDRVSRRIVALVAGAAVGGGSLVLAHVLRADPTTPLRTTATQYALAPVFFGLLFAAVAGWSGLADRGRPRRFRVLPILWTAALGALLSRASAVAVIIPVMCATTIQVVSPWSERAARYAKYLRKTEKDRGAAA